jgi:hypothetical protein
MKKRFVILLVAILLIFVAGQALADEPLYLYINGIQANASPVMINDRVFVPVRFVAENLGATVGWDGNNRTVFINNGAQSSTINNGTVRRPRVTADSEEVKSVINAALDLLEENAYPYYVFVCQYTAEIAYLNTDLGDNVLAVANAWYITITNTYVEDKRFVPVHVAGVLVHETIHEACDNYGKFYDQSKEEIMACESEIAILKILNAPQWMIDECERMIDSYR